MPTRRHSSSKSSRRSRFAVGAKVRILNPGLNGTVKHVDDEPSVLGEYWHLIETASGEREEPGCNIELIPMAKSNDESPQRWGQIHLHGDHSRINVNSTDNSANVLMRSDNLFTQMVEVANSIPDEDKHLELISRIEEMERAQGSSRFLSAYQEFMSSVADHVTIFAPFLPALARMLSP